MWTMEGTEAQPCSAEKTAEGGKALPCQQVQPWWRHRSREPAGPRGAPPAWNHQRGADVGPHSQMPPTPLHGTGTASALVSAPPADPAHSLSPSLNQIAEISPGCCSPQGLCLEPAASGHQTRAEGGEQAPHHFHKQKLHLSEKK